MNIKHATIASSTLALMAFGLLSLATVNVISPAKASATDVIAQTENTEQGKTEQQTNSSEYVFVAEECDTVTHLIRRALLSLNPDLTAQQVVYAETNVANSISASDLIYVGDKVSIPATTVQEFAAEATALDAASLDAWSTVSETIDLDAARQSVSDRPVSQVSLGSGEVSQTPTPTSGSGDEDEDVTDLDESTAEDEDVIELSEDSDADQSDDGTDSNDSDDEVAVGDESDDDSLLGDIDTNAYWWIVGGGSIGGLWYLLYRRNDEA